MACLEILSPPCPVVYLFHAVRMLVSLLRSCWSCATRQIPVAKCSNRFKPIENRLKQQHDVIEKLTWCWHVDMLTCWHGLQKHRFPNPSAGTILGMQWCALDSTHASDICFFRKSICSCIVLECAPAVHRLCAVPFTRVPGITASASPGRPDELNWFGSMTRLGWAAHWLLKLAPSAPSAPSPGCSSAPNSRTAGSFGCNLCVIRHLSALSWSSNAMQTAVYLYIYIIWFKLLQFVIFVSLARSKTYPMMHGISTMHRTCIRPGALTNGDLPWPARPCWWHWA